MVSMDIAEIRRVNLRHLSQQCGGPGLLAERLDKDSSQISNWIGPNPKKGISDRTARYIEEVFSKPRGWLDTVHNHRAMITDRPRLTNVNVEEGPGLTGAVPLISWDAAGQLGEVMDTYAGDAESWYPCPVSHGPRTYVLRVRGASMEPRFREGELIFVDPDREPVNGSFVVIRFPDTQEATFKRLVIEGGQSWLEATNPAWPDRYIPLPSDAVMCGVVIFKGEPL